MKNKMEKEIRVRVQNNLYKQFSAKCEREFKTVSIVIRDLMTQYIDEDIKAAKAKIEKLEDLKLQMAAQNPQLFCPSFLGEQLLKG